MSMKALGTYSCRNNSFFQVCTDSKANQEGFFLIELLVALVASTIAFVILTQWYGACKENVVYAQSLIHRTHFLNSLNAFLPQTSTTTIAKKPLEDDFGVVVHGVRLQADFFKPFLVAISTSGKKGSCIIALINKDI